MRALRETGIFALSWAAVWFPSSFLVGKFFGPLQWAFSVAVALAVIALLRTAGCRDSLELRRNSRIFALLIFSAIAVTVVLAYPMVNQGISGGSDRDEEMLVAADHITRGWNPYDGETYLGWPVNKLPGLLFLSFPFYAFVHPTSFSLVSIALLFIVFEGIAQNSVRALGGWILATALSVVTIHDVATGGTLAANAILVLAGLVVTRRHAGEWPSPIFVCAVAFLATAMCSRINFLLIAPLVVMDLWRRHGRGAVGPVATFALVIAFWTALYLYLGGFNNVGVTNVFKHLEEPSGIPSVFFSAAIVLIAIAAAVWPGSHGFWLRAACVGFFSVVILVFTPVLFGGGMLLPHASYGLTYLFFAIAATIEPRSASSLSSVNSPVKQTT